MGLRGRSCDESIVVSRAASRVAQRLGLWLGEVNVCKSSWAGRGGIKTKLVKCSGRVVDGSAYYERHKILCAIRQNAQSPEDRKQAGPSSKRLSCVYAGCTDPARAVS